jgi:oxygen-independent coproporphyrinogen III oxidase
MMLQEELILKYNVPAPRYTSYPTVPYWNEQKPGEQDWFSAVKRTFDITNATKGISLYIHLPFCESLCTYCGCNTRITRNHQVEPTYIKAILAEWQLYVDKLGNRPIIRELHLGGGTPTFFSPENLAFLLKGIFEKAAIHPQHEFSFEGHPNNTTTAHLQTLYELGFRRVSYGIQDFDEKVQKAINRIQPFAHVERATTEARRIGYESVNFDLVYGLPFQTRESIARTLACVAQLKPDRIAFYSYAHVPWLKPGQRGYDEKDLPVDAEKRALYELGLEKFMQLGYTDIGMDHFALPGDALYKAMQQKTLHRNFMGYTTCATELLIGLGTSAISDAGDAYLQNVKKVEEYQQTVFAGELPILKGHLLTRQDSFIKQLILNIICKGEVSRVPDFWCTLEPEAQAELLIMQSEGLLELTEEYLRVTPPGKAFIRNICMAFDVLHREKANQSRQLFSKAI